MIKKLALGWLSVEVFLAKMVIHVFYRDPNGHEYMMLWLENKADLARNYVKSW